MKYEITTDEKGELALPAQVVAILDKRAEIKKAVKQLEEVEKAIKYAMEYYDIDVAEIQVDGKSYRIKLTPSGTQTRIDNDKVRDVLDRAGIALSQVQKEVSVSSRLTITEREED